MARVFIDGFEAGDLKLWDAAPGTSVVAAVSGMDGSYCLYISASGEYVKKTIPSNDEYYVAFLYRPVDVTWSKDICCFYNGTTLLGSLRRNGTTNVLEIYRGVTLVETGTISNFINTTYLIEVCYKPAENPNGVFQVKVNGVLDIDFSGDTTDGPIAIDGFQLGLDAWTSYGYYDNIVIDDATWPGNTKIQAIVPTGAGASTQWAPSAGSNYACVDEVPASETDYVSTNTAGHLDTYAAGDLTGDIENIKCVQVQALAVKEGAPTPLNLELAVKSGATTYLSADQAVPATTSQALSALWELDPATAAPWEIAAVNALEIGEKAVA